VQTSSAPPSYPYFDIVVGLTCSSDPESCADGSVATGRVSHNSRPVFTHRRPGPGWQIFRGGVLKKSRLKYGMQKKKTVHEREI